MAEEETDYSSLPLVDRAVHKLWKVRKEAYEAAVKCVDTATPFSRGDGTEHMGQSSLLIV
jgi:hypothetical protein